MNIIKETTVNSDANIAIAIARFNNFINNSLLDGALDSLRRIGQVKENKITIVWVPGVYELPLVVDTLARTTKYDAIIALGTIMRGDTAHFKYIADSVSNSLIKIAKNDAIPVAFGVLIAESVDQAIERAGMKFGNKGTEAALSALEMINILKTIKAT